MEDFSECQRRLRAVDADLVSMRALYLDETTAHAESKAAWEEAKREWEAAREGDLARIKELEGVAEAKAAVEGDLAAARESIAALETQVQVSARPGEAAAAAAAGSACTPCAPALEGSRTPARLASGAVARHCRTDPRPAADESHPVCV